MINIDTSNQTYKKMITGLDDLIVLIVPRIKVFSELPVEKQKLWLKRDPLMRKVVKLLIIGSKWINADGFKEDVQND